MVTLYLVVCLLQFNSTTLQLYLYQRQAIDKDCHIITAFLAPLYGNLVGNLKLVLTPLLPPVGVWAVSQSQCGRSASQPGYPSSARRAFAPPST